MMHSIAPCLCLALVPTLLLAPVLAGQSHPPRPVLWAGLEPGPYNVGYRRLDTGGAIVHAWYPTSATGTALDVRAYLGDDAPQLGSFLNQAGLGDSTIARFMASVLLAIPDARPAGRGLPLILVAQGNGQDVIDQVVLCEYLASRGFVVASTPSPMRRRPMEREDQVGEFAELQATELSDAADAVSAEFPVDLRRMGVIGHSFGARAALLVGMHFTNVRAIVSLDGGIGTSSAMASFQRARSYDSVARIPPILHLYETLDAFMAPDFTLLRSLNAATLVLERVDDMHHIHFTTWGFASAVFPGLATATHGTAATGAAAVKVARRTAEFLEHALR